MNNVLKNYFLIIGILLLVILISGIFLFYPRIYDFFYGDKIVEQHIKEVIGNKTNHEIIASKLMGWIHDEVIYPTKKQQVFSFGIILYRIRGKKIFFWRDVPASWTIKKKIGRCGEDANYFVEIMNKVGFKSRKIKPQGWDHAWAEYFTPEGKKIILDPSSNQIILNPIKWVEGKNVTKIFAIDLKGNKEDVSKEYGLNKSSKSQK